MPHGVKIATCCYCGTRAALQLRGKERHELSCAACGAPLHDMKRLRSDRPKMASRPVSRPQPFRKSKRKKRRKSIWHKALEEAFDVIEDVFD